MVTLAKAAPANSGALALGACAMSSANNAAFQSALPRGNGRSARCGVGESGWPLTVLHIENTIPADRWFRGQADPLGWRAGAVAETERRLDVAEVPASCMRHRCDPALVVHTSPATLRFRIVAIACGYGDAEGCDALHADPLFTLTVGSVPVNIHELCSQPTTSRLQKRRGKSLRSLAVSS